MGIRQVSGEASEDLETDIFLTISQAFGSSTKNKDKEQATKRAKAGKMKSKASQRKEWAFDCSNDEIRGKNGIVRALPR